MVTHIVFWNLNDVPEKEQNAAEMKHRLEALVGVVPGLVDAAVRRGFGGWDLCLVSHHTSRAALEEYQQHPAHLEVKTFVHSVVRERASCDFED